MVSSLKRLSCLERGWLSDCTDSPRNRFLQPFAGRRVSRLTDLWPLVSCWPAGSCTTTRLHTVLQLTWLPHKHTNTCTQQAHLTPRGQQHTQNNVTSKQDTDGFNGERWPMIWGETKMIFQPNVKLVQTICFHIPLEWNLNIILILILFWYFYRQRHSVVQVDMSATVSKSISPFKPFCSHSEEKMLPISGHILRKSFQATEMDNWSSSLFPPQNFSWAWGSSMQWCLHWPGCERKGIKGEQVSTTTGSNSYFLQYLQYQS